VEQPVARDESNDIEPAVDVQLPIQVLEMRPDRVLRDREPIGDLLELESPAEQDEDGAFPLRQALELGDLTSSGIIGKTRRLAWGGRERLQDGRAVRSHGKGSLVPLAGSEHDDP
jgi:hypothetical protein